MYRLLIASAITWIATGQLLGLASDLIFHTYPFGYKPNRWKFHFELLWLWPDYLFHLIFGDKMVGNAVLAVVSSMIWVIGAVVWNVYSGLPWPCFLFYLLITFVRGAYLEFFGPEMDVIQGPRRPLAR